MRFGRYEVELDLESTCLVIFDTDMEHILHIGGDQIDMLDKDSNHLASWELPV